jgi:NADH-quinone oxidoreductase subunit C
MSVSIQDLAAEFRKLCPRPAPAAGAQAGSAEGVTGSSAPAPVSAAPVSADPCTLVEHGARGVHLDVRVLLEEVVDAAQLLDVRGFAIDAVTGVDWMAEKEMEVVYDYFHPTEPWRVSVRVRVPRRASEVPSIQEIFPGANWHERETHDFFGIRFTGHPNLEPLLLPEDADYHPLRKDFGA